MTSQAPVVWFRIFLYASYKESKCTATPFQAEAERKIFPAFSRVPSKTVHRTHET
jgi:hypothetical protein